MACIWYIYIYTYNYIYIYIYAVVYKLLPFTPINCHQMSHDQFFSVVGAQASSILVIRYSEVDAWAVTDD